MNYVASVQRISLALRRFGFDLVLILLALDAVLSPALRDTTLTTPLNTPWSRAVAVIILLVPLFLRRRFPFAAPLGVWMLGTALSFVDGGLVASSFSVYFAGVAACYFMGNLREPTEARFGLAAVVIGAVAVVYNDPHRIASDFLTIPGTFAIAWLAGFALRARADRADEAEGRAAVAERERESAARVAVAEERSRITRELHDVVAHAVSVMVLQVGAVRHRLPVSQSENREALQAVEETGRSALNEMRLLLGVIHDVDAGVELSPQPGLDRLDLLLEEVRLAGLEVGLSREGQPVALPRAIDLSAYRIVQEALTNCLKHSGAGLAEVRVRYGPDQLEIAILDDGVGPTPSDGLGRGILGIRERVKIYGGEMATGVSPDGGFRLEVRLPIGDYPR